MTRKLEVKTKQPSPKLIWAGLFFICLLPILSGCVMVALGAAGVAGGYAMSGDGYEGITDKSYDEMWNKGKNVLTSRGTIQTEDKVKGTIEAKVDDAFVTFRVEQATPKSVVVRVQARQLAKAFPDLKIAKEIYDLIMKGILAHKRK